MANSKSTEKIMIGALVPGALDILYEAGYQFADFPDIPTIGRGSGKFALPNLDDCLIDLGVPLLSYLLTGMSDYTKGALAYGIPMFLFNTWRMTAAEIKAGPGVLTASRSTIPKMESGQATIFGSAVKPRQTGTRQTPTLEKESYEDNVLLV